MVNDEKKLEFWSISTSDMLKKLQTTTDGLKSSEVRERLNRYGANILKPKKLSDTLKILLSQFKSPITLILIFASGLSDRFYGKKVYFPSPYNENLTTSLFLSENTVTKMNEKERQII